MQISKDIYNYTFLASILQVENLAQQLEVKETFLLDK